MDITKINFEKMSEETEISIDAIKKALGILSELSTDPKDVAIRERIKNVSTTTEARKLYEEAKEDSREEKMAQEKWNELSLIEIEKASTLDEAKKAFDNTPDYGEAEMAAWTKQIDLATTTEEIDEIYKRTDTGSKEERMARRKWKELSLVEIEKASTPNEATSAYFEAQDEVEIETAAIRKIATFYQVK